MNQIANFRNDAGTPAAGDFVSSLGIQDETTSSELYCLPALAMIVRHDLDAGVSMTVAASLGAAMTSEQTSLTVWKKRLR